MENQNSKQMDEFEGAELQQYRTPKIGSIINPSLNHITTLDSRRNKVLTSNNLEINFTQES